MTKSLYTTIAFAIFLFGATLAADGEKSAMDHYTAYQEALQRGDHETALHEADRAYNKARREWGRRDKRTALMASNLGGEMLLGSNFQGAKRAFEECASILSDIKDASLDLGYCHLYLGVAVESAGDANRAEAAYADAVAILTPLAPSDQNALTLAADASLAQTKLVVAADFNKSLPYSSPKSFQKKRKERYRSLQTYLRRNEDLNRRAYGENSKQMVETLVLSAKTATRYYQSKTARNAYARAYEAGVEIYGNSDAKLENIYALLLQADIDNGAPNTMLIGRRDLAPSQEPIAEVDCTRADLPKTESRDACPMVRIPPRYPNISPYVSGIVVLHFDVLEDGSTANFHVFESKPEGRFDKAAIRSVKKWSYLPPIDENGDAYVRRGVETVVTFELQGEPIPYRERYCFEFPLEARAVSTCSVSRKLPYYPAAFRHTPSNGYAIAHYDIKSDGAVTNVRMSRGWPGDAVNEVLREAVETWVYEPPKDSDGAATAINDVETILIFALED